MQRAIFPLLVTTITGWAVIGSGLVDTLGIRPVTFGGIVVFYTIVGMLEAVAVHRREWRRPRNDVRTDATHLLLTGPLSALVFDATIRSVAVAGGLALGSALGMGALWPTSWPVVAQLFLAITIAELGHYVFHRVSHETDAVWRLHATHHSAERLYWLNATRFHPFDLFSLLVCQSTPLFLLGIEPRAYVAYAIFSALYGQVQHCNVEAPTGRWIDWVFSTPGIHRWHHSIDPREGNHNYGAILNVWDHVFGTYFRPAQPFAGPVGIAGMPQFPTGYLAQLAVPFRWRRLHEIP